MTFLYLCSQEENIKMKIIIVDDNPSVRTSLKFILSRHFDNVVAIPDPTMLPAILSAGHIDAILLDMNFDSSSLDGSDGIFWLKRIKDINRPPAVVMITAFGDIPIAVEAMKLGAEDFVTKPWDNVELVDKIKHAIEVNAKTLRQNDTILKASALEQRQKLRDNMTLNELKIDHVLSVIEQCGGNLKAAAERLGVNRQTLYNIIRKQ